MKLCKKEKEPVSRGVRRLFREIGKAVLIGSIISANSAPSIVETLFWDNFNHPDGVLTNEFSYWNPSDPAAIFSPDWEMDSGSSFRINGAMWTGIPDDVEPNALSSNGNDSCVFRFNTKRNDFTNMAVHVSVLNRGLTSSKRTPAVDWDGLHIWVRYQSEISLYYASINRRDNTVVIKKKVPGGPSNGGTYIELSSYVHYAVPYGAWQQVIVTAENNPNGSVTIKTFIDSKLVVSATDTGADGAPPITGGGKVGIRGDNADLKFENFYVTTLPSANRPPAITTLTGAPLEETSMALEWPVKGFGRFFCVLVFSGSEPACFLTASISDIQFTPGGTVRARVSGLPSSGAYNAFVYTTDDLQTWSLASNSITVQTGPSPGVAPTK